MSRLLSIICSAAVMLASSGVFAQEANSAIIARNGNSNSCDPCNKPKCEKKKPKPCEKKKPKPCKKAPKCEPCEEEPVCCFFEQGLALPEGAKPPCDVKFYPAYNAAAGVSVECAWDLNISGSFIYWDYNQDAMDVTYVNPVTSSGVAGRVVNQSTGYKPGFKVGLGWDTFFDNWNVNAEYTWFHHTQSGSATTVAAAPFVANDWFPSRTGLSALGYTGANSTWEMHMDMVDLVVGRPFYQGTHVTISPSGGLRGLWLRQEMNVGMTGGISAPAGASVTSDNSSHSWAIGPKAGVNSHWIIWKGLRFDGVMGASVLYTKYTSIENKDTLTTAAGVSTTASSSNSYNTIRPTFDMGLGLGYGSYMYRNKFFVDLAVRYDFSQFWSQNVMRNFASQLEGYDDAIGDLHMHGLTIDLSCDF